MKRVTIRLTVVLMLLVLGTYGCKREQEDSGANATIAPADPKPASTGTEELTQTVEIGDEDRSEAEGGALTAPGATAATTATTSATTTPPTTTAAPPPTTTTR